MWIDKLADGVVQVQTPIGPRYVMPSFLQRVIFFGCSVIFRFFLMPCSIPGSSA